VLRKLTLIATIALVATAFLLSTAMAQEATKEAKQDTVKKVEAAKYDYVGHKKCKICHKTEHDSWMETVHAKAWDALKPEEQKKAECIGCHSTGKDKDGELLTGVQCEACHGPGSAYKSQKIMKDKELAIANGLIMPTAETCEGCHNKKSPTFKGFKFEEAVKNMKAMHVMKEAKTEGK